MAINRGEKQKVLTVKIQIPFEVKRKITDFIWSTYFTKRFLDKDTLKYLKDCVQDAYDRLIEPHIIRQIRYSIIHQYFCMFCRCSLCLLFVCDLEIKLPGILYLFFWPNQLVIFFLSKAVLSLYLFFLIY